MTAFELAEIFMTFHMTLLLRLYSLTVLVNAKVSIIISDTFSNSSYINLFLEVIATGVTFVTFVTNKTSSMFFI